MNRQNIYSVKEIEDECFANPWSLDSFERELSKVGAYFYVAMENGEALGYIGFNICVDEGYIANVAVKAPYRRRGVAKALIERVIEKAREENLAFVSLEVREGNLSAIDLYSKFGFALAGRRKNFYRNPYEDGLIMTKTL